MPTQRAKGRTTRYSRSPVLYFLCFFVFFSRKPLLGLSVSSIKEQGSGTTEEGWRCPKRTKHYVRGLIPLSILELVAFVKTELGVTGLRRIVGEISPYHSLTLRRGFELETRLPPTHRDESALTGAPLKPKPGLNGPPASQTFATVTSYARFEMTSPL